MKIKTINFTDEDAPKRLVESLKETGFAIIDKPPLNFELLQSCYQAWEDFFAKPDSNFLYDDKTGAGWVSVNRSETAKGSLQKDLKEFYHFYRYQFCPKNISSVTEQSFDALFELASTLLNWIDGALPPSVKANFDRPLNQMISDANTLFRVIHYPPLNAFEETGGIRAAAHEDINLITILPPGTAEGLEVKTTDGNWFPVNVTGDQVVVNIGDMLQELTNHHLISTSHRVVNPKDVSISRYSMPLFLHPHDDVRLSDAYPTANMYLTERLKELGLIEA